jgi:hypothetical protein
MVIKNAVYIRLKEQEQGNTVDVSPNAKLSASLFEFGLPSDCMALAHGTAVPSTARSEGADEVTLRHLNIPCTSYLNIVLVFL